MTRESFDLNASILSPSGFPRLPTGWSTSLVQTELYCVAHSAPDAAKSGRPALFVVHGQGEHGGRYLHLPALFDDAFSSVACVDLQGHGQSTGQRGHIDSFDQYNEAVLKAFRAWAGSLPPATPLFWMGHSMGGLISLDIATREVGLPLRGFLISSPLLALSMPVPKVKEAFGRLMAHLWGSLSLTNGIDVTKLSHDPALQRAYATDPLVHSKVTPRFFIEMEKAMARVRAAYRTTYPVMVVVAGDDQVVSTPAAKTWFDALQAPVKDLYEVPGGRHENLNEGGPSAPKGSDKGTTACRMMEFVGRFKS